MKFDRVLYLVVAAVALVWTQWLALDMIRSGASLSSTWDAMTANTVAQFVSVDLFAVFLAAMTFMIVEGRRLRMKLWWLYPLLSITLAVSVGFPLFLFARSKHQQA